MKLRIASRLAGLIFLGFGMAKFANHGVEVDSFRTYGLPFPDAFVYLIGVVEVVGGALLLAGRGAQIAAPVLAADMIGAIVVSGVARGEWISLTLAPALLAVVTRLWIRTRWRLGVGPGSCRDPARHTDPSPLAGIRTARQDETASLREIHRRASYIWPADAPDLDANPEIFGVDPAALAAGRVRVAIARAGNLLGFATMRRSGDDAELDDLFVEPRAMRHGVGSALLEDAARRARQAGFARLLVVAHPRTLAFYRRAGFVEQGPAATRFGPALRLARDLQANTGLRSRDPEACRADGPDHRRDRSARGGHDRERALLDQGHVPLPVFPNDGIAD